MQNLSKQIMPQLDKVTYISQIFWLFLTFGTLYLLNLRYILPKIVTITKTRRIHLDALHAQAKKFSEETLVSGSWLNNSVISFLRAGELVIRVLRISQKSGTVVRSVNELTAVNRLRSLLQFEEVADTVSVEHNKSLTRYLLFK